MTRPVIALAMLCGVAAWGQDSASISQKAGAGDGSLHFGRQPGFSSVIAGAPYSAEMVAENVQTLADGTHITRTMEPIKVYRDSYGRTRQERHSQGADLRVAADKRASGQPLFIEITDPVAHIRYILDPQTKVAHRQKLAEVVHPLTAKRGRAPGSERAPHKGNGIKAETEKLEPQIIEGVLAEGTRRTFTWPEGSVGNDRTMTSVTETWRSPELQVRLLIKTSDPRLGEHTDRLINLNRSEPDPSLFVPPPDYTVVDEKGEFTVKWR